MSVATRIVTAEELARMPDDGCRYELVRGELKQMPPSGGPHGNVANEVSWSLTSHVKAHQLGIVFAAETGFRLSSNPDTVCARPIARSSVANESNGSAFRKATGRARRI